MRWLNPAALLGLFAIAVPVFIHLFGRRVAKKLRFPSLRMLQRATPSASSRSQPSDILLLVVRCAVVAAAALALAQPSWSRPDRDARRSRPARAIIVDTSLSMRRLTSAGVPAINRARDLARAQLDSAREGIVIETVAPGANIAAAASWLETRSGLRQLVIVSDFQTGSVQGGEFAHVPRSIGIQLERIDVQVNDSAAVQDPYPGVSVTPRARETEATWDIGAEGPDSLPLTILSSPDDSLRVRASISAAASPFPLVADSLTLVFPGYSGYGDLARRATRFNQSWQGDFLVALLAHPLVANAEPARPASDCAGPMTTPVRNSKGQVVASVTRGDQSTQVLVFSCATAGSVGGSALLSAVVGAASRTPVLSELEPSFLPDEQLQRWVRPPVGMNPNGTDDTSPDGRWLWLMAIVLLLVEEWIRRRAPRRAASAPVTERHQRVA